MVSLHFLVFLWLLTPLIPAYGVLCLQTKGLTTCTSCSFTHFTRFFVRMSVDEKEYRYIQKGLYTAKYERAVFSLLVLLTWVVVSLLY